MFSVGVNGVVRFCRSVNNLTVVSKANQSAIPGYLNKGPPIMMNPDKIVLHSPFDKYERIFCGN